MRHGIASAMFAAFLALVMSRLGAQGVSRPDLATDSFHGICAHVIAIPANGHYSFDATGCMTGYDAIGGDIAYATWFSPAGDREIREVRAPFLEATLGTANVDVGLMLFRNGSWTA